MAVDITYHFPPELMSLLTDAIPLLNRSKKDVLLFFRGAGVPRSVLEPARAQLRQSSDAIRKRDIARSVLQELNERGDTALKERREVLRRVAEFDTFSACWPDDQYKARGLVAEIRNVINTKDTVTRIEMERRSERSRRMERVSRGREVRRQKHEEIRRLKDELFALFAEADRTTRGKVLEDVLNRLFRVYGLGVRESFALVGDAGEGVVEQIDGFVELDGEIYLVEIKWCDRPVGRAGVSEHLTRIFARAEARAIIISASSFTEPAITVTKDALQDKVVILGTLEELVMLLEQRGDLRDWIRHKVKSAIIDRHPYVRSIGTGDG